MDQEVEGGKAVEWVGAERVSEWRTQHYSRITWPKTGTSGYRIKEASMSSHIYSYRASNIFKRPDQFPRHIKNDQKGEISFHHQDLIIFLQASYQKIQV